jgi:predicted permease
VGFSVALVVWKKAPGEAALFGSNSGYPDMAYFGVPIALTVLGPQGMLPVIVGNIISSFIILPVIMAMLHKGNDGDVSTGIGTTLRNTIKQPIIWAPLLALALMLLGVRLPSLAIHSLKLIGDVSGGLALFTLGILLSFLTPRIDKQVVVAVFLKNLAMPALVLLLALFFKLDPVLAKGAVIIAACPAATMGAMLSSQFDVAQDKIPAQILVSTVTAIVTMAMWIYIAEKLF